MWQNLLDHSLFRTSLPPLRRPSTDFTGTEFIPRPTLLRPSLPTPVDGRPCWSSVCPTVGDWDACTRTGVTHNVVSEHKSKMLSSSPARWKKEHCISACCGGDNKLQHRRLFARLASPPVHHPSASVRNLHSVALDKRRNRASDSQWSTTISALISVSPITVIRIPKSWLSDGLETALFISPTTQCNVRKQWVEHRRSQAAIGNINRVVFIVISCTLNREISIHLEFVGDNKISEAMWNSKVNDAFQINEERKLTSTGAWERVSFIFRNVTRHRRTFGVRFSLFTISRVATRSN